MGKNKFNPRRLAFCAVLIALQVILKRFLTIRIGSWLYIGFGFLPNALAGWLMGPLWGMAVAGCSDLLGALLFPSGPFSPWFTMISAVAGLIYGLLLHRGKANWLQAGVCMLTVAVVCNIVLNTVCLLFSGYIPRGDGMWPTIWTRVIKNLIQVPVDTILFLAVKEIFLRLPSGLRKV